MKEILALAGKDLRLLVRDKAGFFFTFFFPLIYAVFFGSIFAGQSGGGGGMSIAVVDEDATEQSRAFIADLDAADELSVTPMTRSEAENAVRRGKKVAFVVLTKGFGVSTESMFWGRPARIVVGVDPARTAESGMLQGVLIAHAFKGFQDAFSDPQIMRRQTQSAMKSINESDADPATRFIFKQFFGALDQFMDKLPGLDDSLEGSGESTGDSTGWQPVVIESADVVREREGPKNAYEVSFPQAIIWGVLGCAAAFGISIVIERTHGTLVRLRMSPVSQSQILAGKALACFTSTIAMMIGLITFGMLVFKVQPASFPLLALAFVSVAVAFVGIMMFLSVLGRTEQSAGGIGWAVLLVMAMLGGGMIPLFIMPAFMQTLSHVSPVKWAILAMEGAIWRGFSFTEMLTPCAILLAIGLLSFTIGARTFRWTER